MADIRKALFIRFIVSIEAEIFLGLVFCLALLDYEQVPLVLCLGSLPLPSSMIKSFIEHRCLIYAELIS